MPLDPELAAMAEAARDLPVVDLATIPVATFREQSAAAYLLPSPEVLASIVDRTIPGPAGEIPVRIYSPDTPGPRGVTAFFHGSGFVIFNLDTHDHECRVLANRSGSVVVSVDYRLAPEHKFPAAVDDAYAAVVWVAAHAEELGADPARLAVAGDSAGGNLAAVVAQLARDGTGPPIAFQLLVYPVVDLRGRQASYVENANSFGLTTEMMRWFAAEYVRNDDDRRDPRASPLLAESLGGLPPAFVATCEYDPLRDEGEEYARALEASGVAVTLRRYDGAVHGIFQMSQITGIGRRLLEDCGAALREGVTESSVRN